MIARAVIGNMPLSMSKLTQMNMIIAIDVDHTYPTASLTVAISHPVDGRYLAPERLTNLWERDGVWRETTRATRSESGVCQNPPGSECPENVTVTILSVDSAFRILPSAPVTVWVYQAWA